jgi:hypothetical protein
VTGLEEDFRQGRDVTDQIIGLGLAHHLVTRFTSFVAVDLSRRVGRGRPRQIVQPVETPEGVDPEAAGARSELVLRSEPESAEVMVEPPPEEREEEAEEAPRPYGGEYWRDEDRGSGAVSDSTEFNFDDDAVEGDLARPDGERIMARQAAPMGGAEPGEDTHYESESLDAPPAARRGARGCHCRAPASPSHGLGWPILALGLALLLLRRR